MTQTLPLGSLAQAATMRLTARTPESVRVAAGKLARTEPLGIGEPEPARYRRPARHHQGQGGQHPSPATVLRMLREHDEPAAAAAAPPSGPQPAIATGRSVVAQAPWQADVAVVQRRRTRRAGRVTVTATCEATRRPANDIVPSQRSRRLEPGNDDHGHGQVMRHVELRRVAAAAAGGEADARFGGLDPDLVRGLAVGFATAQIARRTELTPPPTRASSRKRPRSSGCCRLARCAVPACTRWPTHSA